MAEVLFIAVFTVSSIVVCCMTEGCTRRRARHQEANQELASVRQVMTERRRQDTPRPNNNNDTVPTPSAPLEPLEPGSAAMDDRVALIQKHVFHTTIERPESVRSMEHILKVARDRYEVNEQGNVLARSYRAATSSVRTMGERECSVCLDPYEAGDVVCWSKTDQCNHFFHQECLVEWLKNHNDCPLCRSEIVPAEPA